MKRLFRNTSANNFHVTLYIDHDFGNCGISDLQRIIPRHRDHPRSYRSATKYRIAHTYQCTGIPEWLFGVLSEAFSSGSVVNLVADNPSNRDREALVRVLYYCFDTWPRTKFWRLSNGNGIEDTVRLRLSGIPKLMLSPEQLAEAVNDVEDLANRLLYDAIHDHSTQPVYRMEGYVWGGSWDYFDRVVQLIEPEDNSPPMEGINLFKKRSVWLFPFPAGRMLMNVQIVQRCGRIREL